jgi:hypothetical protein
VEHRGHKDAAAQVGGVFLGRVVIKAILLALVVSLVGARPVLAYIDPNAGGMLFQVLAVLFASLSAILLFFSRQIRTFVARTMRSLRGVPDERQENGGADSPSPSDGENDLQD